MTLTKAVPVAAVALAFKVKVLAPALIPFGLNEAVTPSGIPAADKVTSPLKPLDAVMLIAVVTLPPCIRLTVAGMAATVNTAGQLLTRLVAFTVPMPVAKSHPVVAANAG